MSLSNRRAMVAILNHRDRQAAGKRANVTRRLNQAAQLLRESLLFPHPDREAWKRNVVAFLKEGKE